MVRIGIIGCGIIGSATAYRLLLQHPECNVTILAKELSPNTTSDGAAGFWEPYTTPKASEDIVMRHSKETLDYALEMIKNNPDSNEIGIFIVHGYDLSNKETYQVPSWTKFALDYHLVSKEELKRRFPDYIKSGMKFSTVITEGRRLIPYYLKKVQEFGGKIVKREVNSIEEIADDFDIIVNCSGFGSKNLFNDQSMVPIRGQVIRIEAPWIKEFVVYDDKRNNPSYILPNQEFIVVGGTAVESDNKFVSENDKEEILKTAMELVPSLKNGKVLKDWVGFRPLRTNGIRIEFEDYQLKPHNTKTNIPIIHHYGHGGCGLTLHWGSAGDAVKTISQTINDFQRKKSRL